MNGRGRSATRKHRRDVLHRHRCTYSATRFRRRLRTPTKRPPGGSSKRRAAISGSQYGLGLLFLAGKGVVQDQEEALKWIRRAADHGHATARSFLANERPAAH